MRLHVTRRRRPDGLIVLLPRDHRVERPEWYTAGFSVLLTAWALFVSTAIPAQVLGAILLGLVLGELCFAIRTLLDLRNPRADVVFLSRATRFR
jgi:hypothetical protein